MTDLDGRLGRTLGTVVAREIPVCVLKVVRSIRAGFIFCATSVVSQCLKVSKFCFASCRQPNGSTSVNAVARHGPSDRLIALIPVAADPDASKTLTVTDRR